MKTFWLGDSLNELPLWVGTVQALFDAGLYSAYIGQVSSMTDEELLKIPKFGKRRLQDLRNVLAGKPSIAEETYE